MDQTTNRYCQVVNHQNLQILMVCMSETSKCAIRFMCCECLKLHSKHIKECYPLREFFKLLQEQRVKYTLALDFELMQSSTANLKKASQQLLKETKLVLQEYKNQLVDMIDKQDKVLKIFDKACNGFQLNEGQLKEMMLYLDVENQKMYKQQVEQQFETLRTGIQQIQIECNNFKLTIPQQINFSIIDKYWSIPQITQQQHTQQSKVNVTDQSIRFQPQQVLAQCNKKGHSQSQIVMICMFKNCEQRLMCIHCCNLHEQHIDNVMRIELMLEQVQDCKQLYLLSEMPGFIKLLKNNINECQTLIEYQVKAILQYQMFAMMTIQLRYMGIQDQYAKAKNQHIINITEKDIAEFIKYQQASTLSEYYKWIKQYSSVIAQNSKTVVKECTNFKLTRLTQIKSVSLIKFRKYNSSVINGTSQQLEPIRQERVSNTQVINQYTAQNIQQGSLILTNIIQLQTEYNSEGKPVGVSTQSYFTDNHSSIILFEQGYYKEGIRDGYWKIFSRRQKNIGGGIYQNGMKNGIWLEVDVQQDPITDEISIAIYECEYTNGTAGNRILKKQEKY